MDNSQGYVRTIDVPNPGNQTNFFLDVPRGVKWRPINVSFVFTTSAQAGNRDPRLGYEINGVLSWLSLTSTPQGPSGVFNWRYAIQANIPVYQVGGQESQPLPDMWLAGDTPVQSRIRTVVTNFAAFDNLTAIQIVVEEVTLLKI